jgi:hypothetical protein
LARDRFAGTIRSRIVRTYWGVESGWEHCGVEGTSLVRHAAHSRVSDTGGWMATTVYIGLGRVVHGFRQTETIALEKELNIPCKPKYLI